MHTKNLLVRGFFRINSTSKQNDLLRTFLISERIFQNKWQTKSKEIWSTIEPFLLNQEINISNIVIIIIQFSTLLKLGYIKYLGPHIFKICLQQPLSQDIYFFLLLGMQKMLIVPHSILSLMIAHAISNKFSLSFRYLIWLKDVDA